ncbi:hypothetical protein [Janibacter sp. GS2]|uniref:hypothetical protein n=1 Tax=Janibacter sp. GS2 TaxID=3442646 RepID=UPI003EC05A16
MRRRRVLGVATAVAVAGTMVLSLSPSDGSAARWRDSATVPAVGPTSGTFGMTATDAASAAPTWSGSGPISNSPRIDLTNQSSSHSSWINVRSTRLDTVVANDGNAILQKAKIDYRYGDDSCASGTSALWSARASGQIVGGTTYTRSPQDKVPGATLTPGQKKTLCPVVALDYAGGSAQRDALLNHAGRALDITTVVNQRSEAPATWASEDRTLTSRYRLAMPTPKKPSQSDVCRVTLASGTPSNLGYYGGFFWGWPDAVTSGSPSTPAMAGGWEILRLSRTGNAWEVWETISGGDARRTPEALNSNRISDGSRGETRQFKLRGYPFAGDKARYVESEWIARASNERSILTDRWVCQPQLPNPDAGPHNMP